MIYEKLESGKQLGINKMVKRNSIIYWYSYAIQKVNNLYFVYESEIEEDKMAMEEYEYETVDKYQSFDEVKNNYEEKYGIKFTDIKPLKGQYIFNTRFYE